MWEHLLDNELFSEPITFLHERLEQGDISRFSTKNEADLEAQFVRPFLDDTEYKDLVQAMFDEEEWNGLYHSKKQKALYLTPWVAPMVKEWNDVVLDDTSPLNQGMSKFVIF